MIFLTMHVIDRYYSLHLHSEAFLQEPSLYPPAGSWHSPLAPAIPTLKKWAWKTSLPLIKAALLSYACSYTRNITLTVAITTNDAGIVEYQLRSWTLFIMKVWLI